MALIALGLLPQVPAGGEENMQPDKLLPANILAWSVAGPDRVFDRKTLFDYMNGAGEVYLAYDFRRLTVRECTKPSAPRIVAEIYAMGSPEDAYGIFSHDQDGKPASVGQEGIYATGLLRFWKGGLFIRLLAEEETEAVRVAVMALGRRIAEGISQEGRKPRLLACLPVMGLLKPGIRHFQLI